MERLIDKCKIFYDEYIKNMIREKYPSYEDRIAVGLVGEGSECFMYDDDVSMDHDYEVSLCMFLTDKDHEEIGESLENEYKKCVENYCVNNKVIIKNLYNDVYAKRRGVIKISDFYSRILGIRVSEEKKEFSDSEYCYIEDKFFATCTNGEVFVDKLHKFSDIRDVLKKHYPKSVFIKKLKYEMHMYSQNGQSNYARSMARKDYVTASICINNAIISAMNILCLIEKEYAPYYKWLRKKVQSFGRYDDIDKLMQDIISISIQKEAWDNYTYDARYINKNDKVEVSFDKLGSLIAKALYEKGYINENQSKICFLEALINDIKNE